MPLLNLMLFRERVTEPVQNLLYLPASAGRSDGKHVLSVVLVYCFVITKGSLQATYDTYIPLNESVNLPEIGLATN